MPPAMHDPFLRGCRLESHVARMQPIVDQAIVRPGAWLVRSRHMLPNFTWTVMEHVTPV